MTRHPPAFAVVWDPAGGQRRRCMAWAAQRGGSPVLTADSVIGFSFGEQTPVLGVCSFGELRSILLGEIYQEGRTTQESGNDSVLQGADAAALVASAYLRHGDKGLSALEGLFCTVLWSGQPEQLVLYRDRSCAYNLYWHQGPGWAAAATRLEILADVPGVPKRVADAGLHEYLRFLDISPPRTIYAEIDAVEAGLPGIARAGRLEYPEKPCHYRSQRQPGPAPTPAFTEALDLLDEALHASVAARLSQSGTTGIFLSGGIDSALLCAIAADIDRSAIEAITLGFADDGYDETPIAKRIAGALEIRHNLFRYEIGAYAEAFDDFLASIDVPFADPAGLPTLLLYRDSRKHVETVLDGTGADTLLGVMPARHLRLATQYAVLLPPPLRRTVGAFLRRLPPLAGYAPIFDFDAPEELLVRWRGWSRSEITALCQAPITLQQTRFFQIYRAFPKSAHLERYSALLGNLPDDRVHQAAELVSLRVRFPYWDKQVERLIESLPFDYRFTSAEPKRILRALLARYVPSPIWDVPKHGFDFPFVQLLRHADGQLPRRYLSRDVIESHAILSYELVGDHVDRFLHGDDANAFRVWALVVLFGWLDHHR